MFLKNTLRTTQDKKFWRDMIADVNIENTRASQSLTENRSKR